MKTRQYQTYPNLKKGKSDVHPHRRNTEHRVKYGNKKRASRVALAGVTYEAGATRPVTATTADSRIVADILPNVRRGKQFSDFCIATNHGHQPGNWSQEPPDYEHRLD